MLSPGWRLAELGFYDFAGSTVVHGVGGVAALVGTMMLGPRIGKFDKNGRPKVISGHSMPLAALGVFILWLGWFGFNAGSTLSLSDPYIVSLIVINTTVAASAGAVVAMIVAWIKFGKPGMTRTAVAQDDRLDERGPTQVVDVIERSLAVDERTHHFNVPEMGRGDQGRSLIGTGNQVSIGARRDRQIHHFEIIQDSRDRQ